MRSLILHANVFESKIVSKSDRLWGIEPEEDISPKKRMEECLAILFCVEKSDTEQQLTQLYQEIVSSATDMKVNNIMVIPFVHLSKQIASPSAAKSMYLQLLHWFKSSSFTVDSSHFGYNKTFLLDLKSHRCAYKYREFT